MKKINRKSDHCLNCGAHYDSSYNYCPQCGQENTDNYVSTKTLLSEFFNNYLSLDSRFVRTIGPFLFKPGKVTNDFLEGKRLKYAHPIRWYLVISLIQFLLFNLYQNSDSNTSTQGKIVDFGNDGEEAYSQEKLDSLKAIPYEMKYDSSTNYTTYSEKYEDVLLEQLIISEDYSNSEIYDSLLIDNKDFTDRLVYTMIINSSNSSKGELNSYILDKIPLIVFFILPVYAFLLKLFFFRLGYYIKHLIHSIHIHSFSFIVLSLVWLSSYLFDITPEIGLGISLLLTSTFIILSFRRVYKQRWFTLIVKMLTIGFLYSIAAALVLTSGILISMLLM